MPQVKLQDNRTIGKNPQWMTGNKVITIKTITKDYKITYKGKER